MDWGGGGVGGVERQGQQIYGYICSYNTPYIHILSPTKEKKICQMISLWITDLRIGCNNNNM